MVVIAGFLHEIGGRPENGKGSEGESVEKPEHHHQSKSGHEGIIEIHTIPRQRRQPLEADKSEVEFRINKHPFDPASKNSTSRFQKNQQSENQPEKDQSTIVDWSV